MTVLLSSVRRCPSLCLSSYKQVSVRCNYSKFSEKLQPRFDPPEDRSKKLIETESEKKAREEAAKKYAASANWTMVYKFPGITVAKVMCRAKIYQTGITAYLFTSTAYAVLSGAAGIESMIRVSLVSAFASVMLFIFGNFFKRVIGIAYINDERTKVKLAHLTFWGSRKDDVVDMKDLFPLMDTSQRLDDLYCRVERISEKDIYFMSLKFGGIVDKNLFQDAFKVNLPEPSAKKENGKL